MKFSLVCSSFIIFVFGLIKIIKRRIKNETKRKDLVLIGVAVAIYIVAAAMPERKASRENGGVERSANTYGVENAEYITDDMQVETLTDFSEERAFVQFTDYSEEDLKMAEDGIRAMLTDDEGEKAQYAMEYIEHEPQGGNRIALIDTRGKILWKSDRTLNDLSLTEISEFKDGLAYFIFDGNEGESYNIIDWEGNITYTKECSEDFMFLSHGGGLFLAAEHIASLDVDEWQIGTIDKNGDIVAEYKAYEITTPQEKPLSVEEPIDPSSSLQEIDDALGRLAEERQKWVEESWEYDGEIDEEYYRLIEETEMEFQNRYDELTERKIQIQEQYAVQAEEYQEYQTELEEYEADSQHMPETIAFDKNSFHDYRSLSEYLGEDIYRVPLENGFAVLNLDTQSVISLDVYSDNTACIERFITDFKNGSATVLYKEPIDSEILEEEDMDILWAMLPANSYSLCQMEVDGTITPIKSNSWTNYVLPQILNDENEFHDGLLFVPYGGEDNTIYLDKEVYALTRNEKAAEEKGFVFRTGVYYNIDGEVVLEFSEYNGKNIYFCDSFYNGYALMLIQGADQLTYFTVIDKSGKQQFEPQTGFDDVYMSSDGKYLIAIKWHNLTVFDIAGNEVVSVDSEQISSDDGLHIRNQQIHSEHKYDVCDEVIRFRDFYVNVKEKTVIGSHFNTEVEF